jgi:thiol:disulfide interchange protein DsbC
MPHIPARLSALILASALAPIAAWAEAPDTSPATTAAQTTAAAGNALAPPQIARMSALSDRINAVETDTGELMFISGNGRYVIRGQVADLWHAKLIDSYDELTALAGRLDLARIGLEPAELGALMLGEGAAAPTVVFLDPLCPHCKDLLAQLDDELLKQHRFALVLLPVLGRASEQDALGLACLAETDPDAALRALLDASRQDVPTPQAGASCGQEPLQRSLVAAQLLGIAGVPFLIAPDGRTHRGAPPHLAQWIDAGTAVAADAAGAAQ